MFLSLPPLLSSSLLSFTISISLPSVEKNWQSCVLVGKRLFSPITSLPFAPLSQMSPILCEDVRIMQMILASLESWIVGICHFYLSLFRNVLISFGWHDNTILIMLKMIDGLIILLKYQRKKNKPMLLYQMYL